MLLFRRNKGDNVEKLHIQDTVAPTNFMMKGEQNDVNQSERNETL